MVRGPLDMPLDPLPRVQKLRSGGTLQGEHEAKEYVDSLEFDKANHTGAYYVHCICIS